MMEVKKSRILSTKQLAQLIKESNENGLRFCFILGSGASVESGIPSGNKLEMQWMDQLMGDEKLAEDIRKTAKNLHEEGLIDHSLEEIEKAWTAAKTHGSTISSEYYFDIYKLRFYPDPRNGYRYLEHIMEGCEPSLGYHTLAKLLTQGNLNNLVITTNFDSLVEDALFLYTDKKPLVISHESLAGYIEANIQRPMIIKVHRGLLYAPFNSPETTNELKNEWKDALCDVFKTYTPIVIGYGGGDHSLMSFLKEDAVLQNGMYWCYRETSGLPEESICRFVEEKNGYFVTVGGFDALMMEIGDLLYKELITPSGTKTHLEEQYNKRVRQYNTQWDKLNEKPELKEVFQPMNEAEQHEEKKREEKQELTAWDYFRRGKRAHNEGQYETALEEYGMAIKLNPKYSTAYSNRSAAYNRLKEYQKAIEDCTTAIELDPNNVTAYNNRGFAYRNLGDTEKAIENYNKAMELDSNYMLAYYNRAFAYACLEQHEKAIEDYTKAIQLNPKYKNAYVYRAKAYRAIGKNDLAEADERHAESL